MANFLKALFALLMVYALASAGFAWYATAPYRPSHQADNGRVGFVTEEVQLRTTDGITLRGWYSEGPANAPIVAFFHDRGSTRQQCIPIARAMLLEGYSILLMDLRGCGASDGSVQFLGSKESLDVSASMKFLIEQKGYSPRRIAVVGVGSGASAVILAHEFVRDLAAAALFAPYTTLAESLDHGFHRLSGMGLGGVGFLYGEFLRLRIGKNPRQVRPIDEIGRLAPCPIFLLGASEDSLSTPQDLQALFARAGDPKDLYVASKATREILLELSGPELRKRVTDFFATNLR